MYRIPHLSIASSLALITSFSLMACDLVAKNPDSTNQSSQGASSSSLGQSSQEKLSSSSVGLSSIGTSSTNSSANSSAQISSSSQSRFGEFTDPRDGQTYPTIVIGTQTWMARNLNYGGLDVSANKLQQPGQKYCFNNKAEECFLGGGLYQWHVAMNLPETCASKACADQVKAKHQGVCPAGWHIPSTSEWIQLANTLGGMSTASTKIKLNTTPWTLWNTSSNDGNSSGFSAYPNGVRYYEGEFLYHGSSSQGGAIWWSSEEWNADARNAHRYYANQSAEFYGSTNHEKWDAMSVRCLKD